MCKERGLGEDISYWGKWQRNIGKETNIGGKKSSVVEKERQLEQEFEDHEMGKKKR